MFHYPQIATPEWVAKNREVVSAAAFAAAEIETVALYVRAIKEDRQVSAWPSPVPDGVISAAVIRAVEKNFSPERRENNYRATRWVGGGKTLQERVEALLREAYEAVTALHNPWGHAKALLQKHLEVEERAA